jgi:hypothetical protein
MLRVYELATCHTWLPPWPRAAPTGCAESVIEVGPGSLSATPGSVGRTSMVFCHPGVSEGYHPQMVNGCMREGDIYHRRVCSLVRGWKQAGARTMESSFGEERRSPFTRLHSAGAKE